MRLRVLHALLANTAPRVRPIAQAVLQATWEVQVQTKLPVLTARNVKLVGTKNCREVLIAWSALQVSSALVAPEPTIAVAVVPSGNGVDRAPGTVWTAPWAREETRRS